MRVRLSDFVRSRLGVKRHRFYFDAASRILNIIVITSNPPAISIIHIREQFKSEDENYFYLDMKSLLHLPALIPHSPTCMFV